MVNLRRCAREYLFVVLTQFSLVGLAHADAAGTYKYTEKGFDGGMEVKEISSCAIKNELGCASARTLTLKINTVNKKSFSDCDIEAVEAPVGRITSGSVLETLFRTKAEDGEASKSINVKFDRTGAVVAFDGDDLVGLCGMNASFVGRWRKAR